MNWFEAIGLAVLQGLTEFLPISSSAHLILPSQVLGWQDQGLAFDVAVHVGTLLAVVIYFRKDLIALAKAWVGSILRVNQSTDQRDLARLSWLIILATLPAGVCGLLFNDFISEHLRSTAVIATTTILFALLLWVADVHGGRAKTLSQISVRDAVLVGLSQALALIPGTSRSGITMTSALLLGFSRDAAARFSFLLSVPLIAAAGALKIKELLESGSQQQWLVIVVATAVAFVSAYSCIHVFLRFLETIGFKPFVIYRLALGIVLFGLMIAA